MTLAYVALISVGGGLILSAALWFSLWAAGGLVETRPIRRLLATKTRLGRKLNNQKLATFQREALKSKINECEQAIETLRAERTNNEVQRELNKAGKTIIKALK